MGTDNTNIIYVLRLRWILHASSKVLVSARVKFHGLQKVNIEIFKGSQDACSMIEDAGIRVDLEARPK